MSKSIIIIAGGSIEEIMGISGFDHQWKNFSVGLLSTNQFCLQLSGGKKAMIYQ